jgi:hypothetical protein
MSRTPPPAVLAEWAQLANPVDPRETQGGGIPAMEVALTILCFIVVGLRVYIRIFQTKSFGLDDALIIFNLVCVRIFRKGRGQLLTAHQGPFDWFGCGHISW